MSIVNVCSKLWARIRESKWTTLYISCAFCQMIISIAIESVILRLNSESILRLDALGTTYDLNSDDSRTHAYKNYDYGNYKTQYQSILDGNIWFMVFEAFLTALSLSALFFQNTIEIISIVIINILLLFFAATQIIQSGNWTNRINGQIIIDAGSDSGVEPFSKVIIIWEVTQLFFLVICAGASVFLGHKLYKQFGWNIYKKIGANIQTQKMYRTYLVFLLLLKLDFFLLMSFQILNLVFLFGDASHNTRSIILQSIMVVLVVPMVCLALWGVRTENKVAMIIYVLASVVTIINFIYILAEFIIKRDENLLTLLDILGIVLTLLSLFVAYCASRNFGSGLIDHFQKYGAGAVNLESGNRKRFSIDD
ncbi:hypothetical protein Glove_345g26 [Diversispora epigaea]|uniref:TRP C-terminal domain-containing protein n=1 Tax=Diversispora epigaea TaxID=1348612 RepID=A0A397HJT0_9GLOM|nr:hypothetical protein Glove_345g26 [Diversispora epigaea]